MNDRWPSWLSKVLLVIVLGICFWRARTQSFAVDEAWVYNLFVEPPLSTMAKQYDACNHVLHTLAMKVARAELGGGELALRAPSLLAALAYCIVVYRLTALLLSGWSRVLCLALLTLNPLLMDYFVAARGYGLALALFLWAVWCAITYSVRGFERKWLFRAGVLAGLSIVANLVMLVPAAALGFALVLLALRSGWRHGWSMFDSYGGPALTVAFLLLVIPLLPATADNFYYGATTLGDSVDSLISSFLKVDTRWPARHPEMFLAVARYAVVPLIAVGLLAGAAVALRRWLRSQFIEWRLSPFLLLALTVLGSVACLVLANTLAGVKYPMGRTGLYLLPLTFLACFAGAHLLPLRSLRTGLNVLAAFLVVVSVKQMDNRYFTDWKYDAATNRLMKVLENDFLARAQPGQKPVSLGTQIFLSQSAKYYRERRRLAWLEKPEREDPAKNPHDYYLLAFEDTALVSKLGLEVLAEDKLSGEVLARRRQ
jgi:hypothetical protein